jgi:UDP-N-acetylglucosamine acyltransferase
MNSIHPTAILEGNIDMGDGNIIGPNVILRGNITLGDRNQIDAGCIIQNNVKIGSDNYFHPYVAIGALGEMGLKGDVFNEEGHVVIGSNVNIREFVTIHSPVYRMETRIDDGVYLMNKCYVAHDCHVGEGVVLSASVMLAGRCVVAPHANLGLGVTVHQRKHIGTYAMVGMQSVVTRDILPYAKVAGNPVRILGFNAKGAEHQRHEPGIMMEMHDFYGGDVAIETESINPMKQSVYAFIMQYPEALTIHKNTYSNHGGRNG